MALTPTKAKPVEFSTTSRLKKSGESQVLVEAAPRNNSNRPIVDLQFIDMISPVISY